MKSLEEKCLEAGPPNNIPVKITDPEWEIAPSYGIISDYSNIVKSAVNEGSIETGSSEFVTLPTKWVGSVNPADIVIDELMKLKSGFSAGGVIEDSLYTVDYSSWCPPGYSARTAKPHECPHCYRDRHDAPITQRVAGMLSRHFFDPNYDPEKDDSPIVCVGSSTYGPNRDAAPDDSKWTIAAYQSWLCQSSGKLFLEGIE